MTKLLIIRGIPGSGKSTMARQLVQAGEYDVMVEADFFFMTEAGYKWRQDLLPKAHAWCQHEVYANLLRGKDTIVSNTFITLWQIQPYINFCKRWNIDFSVVEAKGCYQNIHGVPEEKVKNMENLWEKYHG